MWCPKCKSEYKQGIKECADCNIPLKEKLPEKPEFKAKHIEFEEVLRTYSQGDVIIIKSILDSVDVDYFFKGERSLNLVKPWADPVRLMVEKENIRMVKELLKDLKIRFWAFAPAQDQNNEDEK